MWVHVAGNEARFGETQRELNKINAVMNFDDFQCIGSVSYAFCSYAVRRALCAAEQAFSQIFVSHFVVVVLRFHAVPSQWNNAKAVFIQNRLAYTGDASNIHVRYSTLISRYIQQFAHIDPDINIEHYIYYAVAEYRL